MSAARFVVILAAALPTLPVLTAQPVDPHQPPRLRADRAQARRRPGRARATRCASCVRRGPWTAARGAHRRADGTSGPSPSGATGSTGPSTSRTCQREGTFRLVVRDRRRATLRSFPFRIEKNLLERHTLSDVVYYFKGQRSSGPARRRRTARCPSRAARTSTSTPTAAGTTPPGDYGKHLSHLSFSTYFNPQQLPLTAWGLLKTHELLQRRGDPALPPDTCGGSSTRGPGAPTILVRVKAPGGSFYRSVSAPGARRSGPRTGASAATPRASRLKTAKAKDRMHGRLRRPSDDEAPTRRACARARASPSPPWRAPRPWARRASEAATTCARRRRPGRSWPRTTRASRTTARRTSSTTTARCWPRPSCSRPRSKPAYKAAADARARAAAAAPGAARRGPTGAPTTRTAPSSTPPTRACPSSACSRYLEIADEARRAAAR